MGDYQNLTQNVSQFINQINQARITELNEREQLLNNREERLNRLVDIANRMHEIVVLNVGGTKYSTYVCTLVEANEDNLFSALLAQRENMQVSQVDNSIFIDRSPDHFPFIMEFLRHRSVLPEKIRLLNVNTLLEMIREAEYYNIDALKSILDTQLRRRFDTYYSSHVLEFSNNETVVTRKGLLANTHQSATLMNVCEGRRYVEFRVLVTANGYIMIGVQNGVNCFGVYPGGGAEYPGFSYYGANGHLYNNATNAAFGAPTYTTGDSVGVLVDMDVRQVTFFKNRRAAGNPVPIDNSYNDLRVVVNLYSADDKVEIRTLSECPPV